MTFPLASLPLEVVSNVLEYLSPDDILNISKLIPLVITERVYHHAFHDDTRLSYYDLDVFEKRAKAKLYVIGDLASPKFEPLIYGKNASTDYEFLSNWNQRRMHTPHKIEVNGTIVQASISHKGVYILNPKGEVHLAKTCAPSPVEDTTGPYIMKKASARENVPDDFNKDRYKSGTGALLADYASYVKQRVEHEDDPNFMFNAKYERMINAGIVGPTSLPPAPKPVIELSNKLCRQQHEPTNFVDLASGEELVGLDSNGMLWFWDRDADPRTAEMDRFNQTPLCLIEKGTGTLLRRWIVRMKTDTEGLSCLMRGHGVAYADDYFLDNDCNGVRGGYKCMDDHIPYIQVEIVPETKGAKDYVLMQCYIVCLWPDGRISGRLLDEEEQRGDPSFTTQIRELNKLGTFAQIETSDEHIFFLTTDGRIIDAFLECDTEPFELISRVVKGLPKISSVAMGATHFLALSEDGDVYSWGREEGMNGCLGLGMIDTALMLEDVSIMGTENEAYLLANKPIKIKLPGKAYAIYAQENYSAFLVEDSS